MVGTNECLCPKLGYLKAKEEEFNALEQFHFSRQ